MCTKVSKPIGPNIKYNIPKTKNDKPNVMAYLT